jgi:hypothetical protein
VEKVKGGTVEEVADRVGSEKNVRVGDMVVELGKRKCKGKEVGKRNEARVKDSGGSLVAGGATFNPKIDSYV